MTALFAYGCCLFAALVYMTVLNLRGPRRPRGGA